MPGQDPRKDPDSATPVVDAELRDFLQWTEQQKRDGFTLANLFLKFDAFEKQAKSERDGFRDQIRGLSARTADLENDRDNIHERMDHHGYAIVAIKRRLRNGSDDPEMDTGTFDLVAIQKRLVDQEKKRADSERVRAEDQVWWKRSIIMWLVGGLGALAMMLLTIIITLAISSSSGPRINVDRGSSTSTH